MNDKEKILRILNNYKYSYYQKGDLSIRGYVDDLKKYINLYPNLISTWINNLNEINYTSNVNILIFLDNISLDDDNTSSMIKSLFQESIHHFINYINSRVDNDIEFVDEFISISDNLKYDNPTFDITYLNDINIDSTYINQYIKETLSGN